MENILEEKLMHHTRIHTHTHTQQTTALAYTCLCPCVTRFNSVLGNKSPSSPGTCCCQSTLNRGLHTHGDFVLDRLIQLVRYCRTKYSWAVVATPYKLSLPACLSPLTPIHIGQVQKKTRCFPDLLEGFPQQ